MTAPPAEGVGFRSERGPILIALMLSTGLVAIDSTILATAVPSIVHDLGGFSSFPWLFSVYLLAQAVSVPVYAKLSDMVGRKPIILIGIGLFLLGSILCGFAWSMPALIAFRVGAGPGRRSGPADGHHDRRRHLHRGRAGQGAGLPGQRLGDLLGGRPDPRRRVLRSSSSGAGSSSSTSRCASWPAWMLHPHLPREHRARASTASTTSGAALLTVSLSLLILGAAGGRPGLGLELRRRASACSPSAPSCSPRSSSSSGGPPSRCCRCGSCPRRLLATTALVSFGVGAVLLGLTSYVPTFLEGALGDLPDPGRARPGGADARLADQRVPIRAGCTCGSGSGRPR